MKWGREARDSAGRGNRQGQRLPRIIGVPLKISTGQFGGKYVRAELIELQTPSSLFSLPLRCLSDFCSCSSITWQAAYGVSSNEEERSSPQCACAGMRRVPVPFFLFSHLWLLLVRSACGREGEGKRLRFWRVSRESCAHRGW